MQDCPHPEEVRFLVQDAAQPGVGVKAILALPTWESFPTRDRQLLVSTIVQTARRRLQPRLTSQPSAARRWGGHD
jgi:hypothetical protein